MGHDGRGADAVKPNGYEPALHVLDIEKRRY